MFQRIIVPVDLSPRSLTAVRFGASIAAECDAEFEIVHVAPSTIDRAHALYDVDRELAAIAPLAVQPNATVLVSDEVAPAIAEHCELVDGAMIVMASTGRGRSAAVLGSVTDEVLNLTFGPIIVIGPHATEPKPLSGDLLVPVDGSKFSEASLTLAGAWGIALGATPWVVHVLHGDVPIGSDCIESSYAARLARDLHGQTHHSVEYEVLHDDSPAHAIVDYASANDFHLIVMSTHGRTGMRRLRLGSVAAGVVHDADCPVVLHRPPRLPE